MYFCFVPFKNKRKNNSIKMYDFSPLGLQYQVCDDYFCMSISLGWGLPRELVNIPGCLCEESQGEISILTA